MVLELETVIPDWVRRRSIVRKLNITTNPNTGCFRGFCGKFSFYQEREVRERGRERRGEDDYLL